VAAGALHLLPAGELGLWCAGLAPLDARQLAPGALRRIGVTRAEADAVAEAIPAALDGAQLTRGELAGAVAELTGQPALRDRILGQYGDGLLKAPALRGELCFAPSQGARVRFTRPRPGRGRRGWRCSARTSSWTWTRTGPRSSASPRTPPRSRCACCRPTTSTRSAPRGMPRRRSPPPAAARCGSHERRGGRLRVELTPWDPLGRDASAAAEGEAERLAGFLGGAPEIAWAS
jgi:hypothetical protein